MTILTAVLFLKRRLLKLAKSPVLSTRGNDNIKFRYGNDLKFLMAFLDKYKKNKNKNNFISENMTMIIKE